MKITCQCEKPQWFEYNGFEDLTSKKARREGYIPPQQEVSWFDAMGVGMGILAVVLALAAIIHNLVI